MDPHRRGRRPGASTSVALACIKGFALSVLLTVMVVGGVQAGTGPAPRDTSSQVVDAYQRVVERAVSDHDCSYTGYGDAAVPASALIRTARGTVRQVSFEIGWDVYNGRRPGTLIAVCLEEIDRAELVSN